MPFNNNIVSGTAGLVIGIVKDIKDPDKLNRVKVNIPYYKLDTPYLPVVQSIASKEYGSVIIPDVNDVVIVGFINGRIENGIILGCVYHGENKSHLQIDDKNKITELKTKGETVMTIDDTDDKQKVTITTKKGITAQIDDENEMIFLSDKDKKNSIKIDAKNGAIEITGEKKVEIKGGKDTLTIEDGKGMSFKTSGGDCKIESNNFNVKAKANVKIEANSNVELKGNAKVAIQSSGQAVFKGSINQIG